MRRIYFKKITPQPGDIEGHKEFYGKWLCNIQLSDQVGCCAVSKYKTFAFLGAIKTAIKSYLYGIHKA